MEATQIDVINHPPHYMTEAGIEAIDVIERYGFSECFHLATALAYLLRAGRKGDRKEDLGKASWYVRRYVDGKEEHGLGWPFADADAEEWANPDRIVEAFGLTGTAQGRVVWHLLTLALEEDEDSLFDVARAELAEAIAECAQ